MSLPTKGKCALLVVDVQNDFCEGGALPVTGGSSIVPIINGLRKSPYIDYVIFAQDWHPQGHSSFALCHPGHKPLDTVKLSRTSKDQVLWPVHCLAGEKGSEFHPDLKVGADDIVVRKGTIAYEDSYSAFGTEFESTSLRQVLFHLGVHTVFVAGLAYDFCVRLTAEDAAKLGFLTYVVGDASKAVSPEGEEKTKKTLEEKKIRIITSAQMLSK